MKYAHHDEPTVTIPVWIRFDPVRISTMYKCPQWMQEFLVDYWMAIKVRK